MDSTPHEMVGDAVRLDRQNPYLRLQSVTVFVRDLDRSLDFYVNKLGFHLMFDGRVRAGRPFVAVHPPDGTANLTLMMPEADSEQYKLIGRPTQIAFITEDVLAKFRDWSARGVVFQNNPRLRRMKHGTVGAGQAPEMRTSAAAETRRSAPGNMRRSGAGCSRDSGIPTETYSLWSASMK